MVPTIGNAIRMEEDGTIVTTDEEGNETEFNPYLAPALYMDEFETLIYAAVSYTHLNHGKQKIDWRFPSD